MAIFREKKVVRHYFDDPSLLDIKSDDVVELSFVVKERELVLPIYVFSKERRDGFTQFNGYFLDDEQWYLVDLFVERDGKASIVLSPMTPPSLRQSRMVKYYKMRIKSILDLADNLL